MYKHTKKILLLAFLLGACSSGMEVPVRSVTSPQEDYSQTEDSSYYEAEKVPEVSTEAVEKENLTIPQDKITGKKSSYKIGDSYVIEGVPYYPHEDYGYSEVGIASWYGSEFHGSLTSNGEVFDKSKLTAAHRTLPLPSLVRVTNLENGLSTVVKVNDRGPFARDRILDVSERTADLLQFKNQGSTKVRVEIMADESKTLKELALKGEDTDIFNSDGVTYNPAVAGAAVKEDDKMIPLLPVVDVKTPNADAGLMSDEQGGAGVVKAEEPAMPVVPMVNGNYYVQAGAFSSYTNAERLKDKLSSAGNVIIEGGNGSLYKVRVGGFESLGEAESALSKVHSEGATGAKVVMKQESGTLKWFN